MLKLQLIDFDPWKKILMNSGPQNPFPQPLYSSILLEPRDLRLALRNMEPHPQRPRPVLAVSESLPRRLRTRTPTRTLLIPSPRPQPLLRPKLQLPIQLRTRFLAMYEIAEPTPHAALAAVQPTTSLSEIGDGRQLAVDGSRGVPP